jgi:hypothetical protein
MEKEKERERLGNRNREGKRKIGNMQHFRNPMLVTLRLLSRIA